MARPLRIEMPGGRFHLTARGNERKAIYRSDADRRHFLELLGQLSERFGVRLHAYVLMRNHFHLLLQPSAPNLSRAMQWLNVAYSVWFNRRHDRAGHLFQGRYKAVLVEDERGWQNLARYVHLNPVRVKGLKLGKAERARGRMGVAERPEEHIVRQRLTILRQWTWSSYRAYAGYEKAPAWLAQEPLAWLCGGKSEGERRKAIRDYTEGPVRQGIVETPWEELVGGAILGSRDFVQRITRQLRGQTREQPTLKRLGQKVEWRQIVGAVEKLKGKSWEEFAQEKGDWGRDAALWLGRTAGQMKLGELGQQAGGMDYAAVGMALKRFGQRLEIERKLERNLKAIRNELLHVEI